MKYSVFAFTLVCMLSHQLRAQQVTVDWAAKKVTSQPSTIEKETSATVRLDNVNDLMFTYSISYQLKPVPISDFDSIAKLFVVAGKAAGEAATDCKTEAGKIVELISKLKESDQAFRNQPATNAGCSASKPCNIPLAQAINSWNETVQPSVTAAQSEIASFVKACPTAEYKAAAQVATNAIDQMLAKVNGSHSITKENAIELAPDKITSMEVDQLWNDVPTADGSYSVDLQPSNNRLTLSAGALFSEIQNRSYTIQSVPSSGKTSSTSVLSVDGLSRFSPTAIALLNYEIPQLDWERIGFAVSSGPVFRLGTKSDTSSFGFFAGVSAHLFHRFYLTPGYHFGEFADFPPGFSHVGQLVPPGFSTPTPVKRWTWRFGFALSYKAKDFSQFGLSGSVNPSNTNTSGSKKANSGSGNSSNVKTPDANKAKSDNKGGSIPPKE